MDPNTALERIRELAAAVAATPAAVDEAAELAEAVQALDEWISRGGFLPAAWTR